LTGLLVLVAALSGGFQSTVCFDSPALREQDGGFYPVIPGTATVSMDSGPLRPGRIFIIPIPPGALPRLDYRVESVSATGWDGLPWSAVPDSEGSGLDFREVFRSARTHPSTEPVRMMVVPMAGTRVARVTVDPFCFGDLSRYASVVSFSLSWPSRGEGASVRGTILEAVTPEGSLWWRNRERSQESPFWGRPWARIRVGGTGFYAVTGAQLEDAGCPAAGMPTATLAMISGPAVPFDLDNPADQHQTYPVALSVSDGGDGVFHREDTLFFYGRALARLEVQGDSLIHTWHRYDDMNTYWLTWGGTDGVFMDTADASYQGYPSWGPVSATMSWMEQEYTWFAEEPRTGWCWAPIPQGSPSYIHFTPPQGSTGRALRVSILHSRNVGSGGDSLVLNGVTVLDSTFYNNKFMRLWTIPEPDLNQGLNTLKIWSWNEEGTSAFNYLELETNSPLAPGRQLFFLGKPEGFYTVGVPGTETGARAFITDDPYLPVELDGWSLSGGTAEISLYARPQGSMWVVNPGEWLIPGSIEPAQPGRILGTAVSGDIILLLPEELMGYAAALEAVYASRGLSTAAASYREVYDEFNGGVSSPGAVRSLVRHALDHWPEVPRGLLLVGDGNYDPMGYTTGFVPPAPLFRTLGDSQRRFGTGDDGFVMVHQEAVVPEIPVSRIPASTGQELQVYLDRLAAVESAGMSGGWANRVTLSADDEWNGVNISETRATEICENLADSVLPPSMEVEKVYLIDYPWPPGTSPEGAHPEKPEAREDLLDAIDRGCSSLIFFGHGSYNQIAQENLLSTLDIPSMSNLPRLPVAFFASCNTGQFDLLGTDCFSEALVRHPQGGAVAAIGSSYGSYTYQNEDLLGAYLELQYGPQRATIGEAFWGAKVMASDDNNYYYNIMGDGGFTAPMGDDGGTALEVPAPGLFRGRLNTLEVKMPGGRTMETTVGESGANVVYVSPLSGVEIPWMKPGGAAYRGLVESEPDGRAVVTFFMPVQADTGSLARAQALADNGFQQSVAWNQWFAVVDSGGYSSDSLGPSISMSCSRLGTSHLLNAELEDESGICVFGREAGRALLLSVNNQGFDVSGDFQYLPGSHTRGVLSHVLPDLGSGEHTLILAAWDGMGNGSLDTLTLTVTEDHGGLLRDVTVFPNPGRGARAFLFETSSPGEIRVKIFTVAGRPIWEGRAGHEGGPGQLVWSGLDADGDPPAAGAYIYLVTLETAGGATASRRGMLAVSPGDDR
jgi:hypothetical protein